jgi:hypothetical protein
VNLDSALSDMYVDVNELLIRDTTRAETIEYAMSTFGLSHAQVVLVLRGAALEDALDATRPPDSLSDRNT